MQVAKDIDQHCAVLWLTPMVALADSSCKLMEAQWPIGYGVGLRIKRSSVRIRPWPLR